ncbi:hypothetical protein EV700_2336 [Fluviicoccus keumensis]|uniref:START domain-containing protein n=1 Tax=Fluviicoccus keumensis TaxID=1435465 RepID=A0A4Q7YNZ7_9GAMM|nr:START domain-containing protein [Fluviicoccus keumensis]RZU38405.1 hypothetical protein EV700_2336 [Fluviicoccus keumensis]
MLLRSTLKTLALSGLLAILAAPALAEQEWQEVQSRLGNDWRLIKQDRQRQIRTYAKLEDNKNIRSFKVEGILNTRMETIARVLLDFPNYNKWYWEVMESRQLKQTSPTDYHIYIIHRAPYGLPNRDVILRATLELQNRDRNFVVLKVKADPDYMPEVPKLVRMPAEDMTIRFTPLPGQRVMVEAEGFIDPGGKVPSWDANLIQRNAPYTVIMGFQRMVLREEYRNSNTPIPFAVQDYEQTTAHP